MKQRDDAGQIAISGAFPIAVDRPLYLCSAPSQSRQGIGDSQSAIVVRVNTDGSSQLGGRPGDALDFARQCAAVGVAKNNARGPGFGSRPPGGQGVIGFILEPIERVLRIIHNDLSVIAEKSDCLRDHGQILIGRDPKHFLDVQEPTLADDGDHRGA